MAALQASVEKMAGLERKVTLEIPKQEIDAQVQIRLNDLSHKVKIDGFRPGKVPLRVIKQRYGKGVRQEVMGELMRSNLSDIIKEQNLKLASQAEIDSIEDSEATEAVKVIAKFEIFPEIQLKDLKGVSIEVLTARVSTADVEKVIQKLIKKDAQWIETDREAQNGDKLTIDFEGSIDGELFEGGAAKAFEVELGAGGFIPGFEEGLVGVRKDTEVDLNVVFPEDYMKQEMAGKPAKFKVKVHKITEPLLPELDDVFAKRFNIHEGGVEALRKEIYASLKKGFQHQLDEGNKEVVLNKLFELNLIEVPQVFIAQEVKQLQGDTKESEAGLADHGKLDEAVRAKAKKRVTLGLLVSEYIKVHGIEVDKELVSKKIKDIAGSYEQPEQMESALRANKQRIDQIESFVLEEQVVAHLLEQADRVEKKMDYESLPAGG
ncbi:MAG: trigger factor [Gammaproteobacteria bacterium]